ALQVVVPRPVALRDRRARIARGLARAARARERNRRPGEDQTLAVAADLGMTQRPAGMGAERHRDLRQRDPAGLVTVGIDRGDERAARRARARWERREVQAA